MHASTKGSFINETLEDDEATSVGTKPSEQEKLERNTAEKETGRANVAQGSNRALLALVITMCLISLVVLLLTLLMLFGKIGDGCGCSTDEASSISDKSHATNTAKIKTLEENITSLQLGLMEHLDDLAELNNTVIKLEYLDAVLTRLKSALNRTNTDLAELKSTQTKEKVIYHQTMTPTWLEAHASYINSYRTITTEQLTFIAGPKERHAALLKVPMIPANVLQNPTQLTVKIFLSNDVSIGTNEDSDIRFGLSDGINFVGFVTADKNNYHTTVPCFAIEGSSGTTFNRTSRDSPFSTRPSDTFYPGQFVMTLKLDAHESWGSCYTAHDGGFVKTAVYNKRLMLSNGLTLEVYKDNIDERYGIKVIEVTIVKDV
ncbi:hypothetical protein ACROYT_G042084 [Oculina patagonica]